MSPGRERRLRWVMGRPVVHFEIVGEDGARLQAYYAALFGWSYEPSGVAGYSLVDHQGPCGGTGPRLGGGIGGIPGYAGHVTVYVSVPDVEAALAEAERLGGRRVMGPERVAVDVEIGQFTDPEGHLVGVVGGPQ